MYNDMGIGHIFYTKTSKAKASTATANKQRTTNTDKFFFFIFLIPLWIHSFGQRQFQTFKLKGNLKIQMR